MIKRIVLLMGLLSVSAAQATTIPYMSFEGISRDATGIVEGTVDRVTSRKARGGDIYTYVTLRDLRLHKGRYAQGSLTLLFEGGSVGGESVRVEGSPTLRAGERVIAFVAGNGRHVVPLVGWGQGLFRVVGGPAAGEATITDSVGNRVFGVEAGRVIKEVRAVDEAEILGGPESGAGPGEVRAARSELPAAGQPAAGRQATPGPEAETAAAGRPMTHDRFVQAIGRALAASRGAQPEAAPEALVSVQIGAPLRRGPEDRTLNGGARRTTAPPEPELAPGQPGRLPALADDGADPGPVAE